MIFGKEWKLTRWINHDDPISGSVQVTMLGRRACLWNEHVCTRLGDGQMIEGTQHYRIVAEGGVFYIYFATGENKGSLFQRFTFADVSEQTHQCGADTYKSTLEIKTRDQFCVTHDVQGPRKSYVMQTVYERVISKSEKCQRL